MIVIIGYCLNQMRVMSNWCLSDTLFWSLWYLFFLSFPCLCCCQTHLSHTNKIFWNCSKSKPVSSFNFFWWNNLFTQIEIEFWIGVDLTHFSPDRRWLISWREAIWSLFNIFWSSLEKQWVKPYLSRWVIGECICGHEVNYPLFVFLFVILVAGP